MSHLADLIERRNSEIVARFVTRLRREGAATSLADAVIADSVSSFLSELAGVVRKGGSGREPSETAPVHGAQRFELGYDVVGTIREYGALRELLFDAAAEEPDSAVSVAELHTMDGFIIHAIAAAAAQYTAARDTQTREDTRKHLAFLAHELRNPLGSARMALSLARDHGDVRPTRITDSIDRGLSRVAALLDDALVSVRLHEPGALTYEELSLADLLAQLVADTAAEAAAKEQTIRIEGDARAEVDRKTLGSAVSNLLRNAVKFSRRGGTIHLRVKEAASNVTIEVEDSCGGLPEGTAHKLFDPFVQAGTDRSGFGLGLAIAEQAASAHGGTLRVHDLPGQGCAFLLEIPSMAGAPSRARTLPPSAS